MYTGKYVVSSWRYVHGDIMSLNSYEQVQNGGAVTM